MQSACRPICSVHSVHRALIVCTLLAAAAFQPAAGQSFVIRNLGTLPGNASQAGGINERGQAVGFSNIVSGDQHATLFEDGKVIDLGTLPGDNNAAANGINDRGQVVGWSTANGNNERAFLFENGVMTDLGTLPGGNASIATAINNRGQVVGWSLDALTDAKAVRFEKGVVTELGSLGGYFCWAFGINDRGQVVGGSTTATDGNDHAFLVSVI